MWKRIRDCAFFGCINLKHLRFHARLRGIGGDAFNNTSMSEINLPEGLRTIWPRRVQHSWHFKKVLPPVQASQICMKYTYRQQCRI